MAKYRITFKDKSYIEFSTLSEANNYKITHKIANQVNEIQDKEPSDADSLLILELKAIEYRKFGYELFEKVNDKVWAKNTFMKSLGKPLTIPQMQALLNTSTILEKALKTGSFETAIEICNQFRTQLPQYIEICEFCINELNRFMGRIK